jgi:hypothetical protein
VKNGDSDYRTMLVLHGFLVLSPVENFVILNMNLAHAVPFYRFHTFFVSKSVKGNIISLLLCIDIEVDFDKRHCQ